MSVPYILSCYSLLHMEIKKPKVGKKIFKVLTGVVIGGAIGSILGLTLAPKKGKETRQYLRDKSLEMFLEGKAHFKDEKKSWVF